MSVASEGGYACELYRRKGVLMASDSHSVQGTRVSSPGKELPGVTISTKGYSSVFNYST
jgi:hypothetical protein